MAWAELSGSRRVNATPTYRDYVITFTAPVGESLPAMGAYYAGVTGSGSLSSSGLDEEPTIVSIGQTVRVTPLKTHVQIVFRGYRTV